MNKLYAIVFNAMLDISKAYVEIPYSMGNPHRCYLSETVDIAARELKRFQIECRRLTEIARKGKAAVEIGDSEMRKLYHLSSGLVIIKMAPVYTLADGKKMVSSRDTRDIAIGFLKSLEAAGKK